LLAGQLPAGRRGERRLREMALEELARLQRSLGETQRKLDAVASRLRNLGSEVSLEIERNEQILIDLLSKAAGRSLEFPLPGTQETLCLPTMEKYLRES